MSRRSWRSPSGRQGQRPMSRHSVLLRVSPAAAVRWLSLLICRVSSCVGGCVSHAGDPFVPGSGRCRRVAPATSQRYLRGVAPTSAAMPRPRRRCAGWLEQFSPVNRGCLTPVAVGELVVRADLPVRSRGPAASKHEPDSQLTQQRQHRGSGARVHSEYSTARGDRVTRRRDGWCRPPGLGQAM